MDTAKYEIWQEHKKCNNFEWNGQKDRNSWGGKCSGSWVLNLYLVIKIVFLEMMQFLAD